MAAEELLKYQRIVIDQDTCISCGACIEACPYDALEYDDNMKARLIWDKCQDDFSCVSVCPVTCIYKTEEAPQEYKDRDGWYRFEDFDSVKEEYEAWKEKFSVGGSPAS